MNHNEININNSFQNFINSCYNHSHNFNKLHNLIFKYYSNFPNFNSLKNYLKIIIENGDKFDSTLLNNLKEENIIGFGATGKIFKNNTQFDEIPISVYKHISWQYIVDNYIEQYKKPGTNSDKKSFNLNNLLKNIIMCIINEIYLFFKLETMYREFEKNNKNYSDEIFPFIRIKKIYSIDCDFISYLHGEIYSNEEILNIFNEKKFIKDERVNFSIVYEMDYINENFENFLPNIKEDGEENLQLFVQIISYLYLFHSESGYIHNDCYIRNIMIKKFKQPKNIVIDLGKVEIKLYDLKYGIKFIDFGYSKKNPTNNYDFSLYNKKSELLSYLKQNTYLKDYITLSENIQQWKKDIVLKKLLNIFVGKVEKSIVEKLNNNLLFSYDQILHELKQNIYNFLNPKNLINHNLKFEFLFVNYCKEKPIKYFL